MSSPNPRTLFTAARIPVTPDPCPGNAGIRCRYPIDQADWIWHPAPGDDPANGASADLQVMRFTLEIPPETARERIVDLSADQRYILRCGGVEIGRGPDRAEQGGWSFHRYRISLPPGAHELDVICWWLAPHLAPQAQVSARPGFALAGVDAGGADLTTGKASWSVRELRGISALPKSGKLSYHVIGCGFRLGDTRGEGPPVDPVVVQQARDEINGILHSPWRCEPSPLPEQERVLFSGGRIRGENAETFQGICSGQPVRIEGNTSIELLWDFEDYLCAYPRARLRGGQGAVLKMAWAESLYDSPEPAAMCPKGNRGEYTGKHWLGFGDEIHHPGGEENDEVLWWRSGRWMRIQIRTAEEPLEILDLRPRRTGHPFHPLWRFSAPGISADMLRICERGLRNCVHETFVDCPYYEQLQYLGDTRIQALSWLATTGDARPVGRALELFDRSRWVNGLHAERCPSANPQMSATYSLLYPLLLRDFTWWCREPDTVRRFLPGTRSALESALACVGDDGLPHHLPGWLFVDWVKHPFWQGGVPGGGTGEITAPVALHLPLALTAAAEVEDAAGDPLLAERYRRLAQTSYAEIERRFWCGTRNQFADDTAKSCWSEHAQALALLLPFPDTAKRSAMLRSLLHPSDDTARASIYFSFYVHGALIRHGESQALIERLAFWEALRAQGFLTTVEAPEPSRSDCHGWGSHPLYHSLTGLAGIRPDAPGFERVAVHPCPGNLDAFDAALPHPLGSISVRFSRRENAGRFTIETPVPGTLHWEGKTYPLAPGVLQELP
ncbi:MAG: hypothetical protein JJU05_08295 [Verrucomicrobia bacterium]|nr:hypothetical protein [Verrucomicrobiota bacterium]MCH8526712.1 hypothetical protein [Kiritimatiellia bacterium]